MNNSIYNYSLEELENSLEKIGLKKFNAKQIFKWIYQLNVDSFFKMSNISKKNQELLTNNFVIDSLKIIKKNQDKNDGTIKVLFELEDHEKIETVLMKFNYGYSICISTQVGCNMGCKFCASGLLKKIRNLEVNEIVLQVIEMQKILNYFSKEKISNIVFMGVGEPLDNFENIVKSIKIITSHYGIGIGSRHITISTCGLVEKIPLIAEKIPQVNLAISLHAPNDEIRSRIMPINNRWNIFKLLNSIKKYLSLTNRRVTFEYILLKGINDSDENALELSKLLKGMLCYVNIILYNNVIENEFKRSDKANRFANILNKNGIQATIRLERGNSIDAACGQLRAKYENK